jgi:hypothetical protein
MSLAETIKADVAAVESDAKIEAGKLFDQVEVDIRTELPELVAKLGVNTSSADSVVHATIVLLVTLLESYGPAEIRTILSGAVPAVEAVQAAKGAK